MQRNLNSGKPFTVQQIIDPKTIPAGIVYALATGNLGSGKASVGGAAMRTGVSQPLNRMTYSATLSHLRKSNAPLDPSGKMSQPRSVQSGPCLRQQATAQHSLGRCVPGRDP